MRRTEVHITNKKTRYSLLKSVFRIRIRIRSDPYYLAGSVSGSGNVDLDPGTKKTRIKNNQNYKNIIFLEITNFV